MLTPALHAALIVVTLMIVAYFILWNASQILMGAVAWIGLWRYQRSRTRRDIALAYQTVAPPTVSVIVPAYNEAVTIVESVRALLALDYESREIVVVNDGSTDGTLALLQETFNLIPAPLAFDQPIATEPVRAIYRSIREPGLVVLDKNNGGCKSDAVNAGVNAASGRLVLMIDADTVLEPDALSRAVLPFLEDTTTVAVGGNVAIVNGCRVEQGRVTEVALPRSWVARFQIVEYMRSFLLFKVATASLNGVAIISGAFGLFRRDAVIAVGGYDTTAIGEDMDLTLRLQRYYRARREPFRIAFDPLPHCATQAPGDLRSLRNQRWRWRRGLLQSLWRQRRMIGNPRFGVIGLGVLPYIAIFEGLGPLLEIAGYVVTTVAALLGFLNWHHYRMLIVVSLLFGGATTLVAVLLSDIASKRYLNGRDLIVLVIAAILENCGYRQLNSWWGCVGTVQALTGRQGWGVVKRQVLKEPSMPART
jgi:cellulose synthase/poly-beta-1,6-N-acetylglucosamine synthase-like glycosyltransferase